GRLHDRFLRWEAMTPGEYARDGAGRVIRHGWVETPFGEALAMGTERGLCGLAFAAECGREAAMDVMRGRWKAARFVEDPAPIRPWIEAATGQVRDGTVPLAPLGAPFQIKVWEALLA